MTTSDPNDPHKAAASNNNGSQRGALSDEHIAGLVSPIDLNLLNKMANEFMRNMNPADSIASAGLENQDFKRATDGLQQNALRAQMNPAASLPSQQSSVAGAPPFVQPSLMALPTSEPEFNNTLKSAETAADYKSYGQQFGFLDAIRPLFGLDPFEADLNTFASTHYPASGHELKSWQEDASRAQNELDSLGRSVSPAGMAPQAVPTEFQKYGQTYSPGTDGFYGQRGNESVNDAMRAVSVVPSLEPLSYSSQNPLDLKLNRGRFDVGEVRRDFPILQEKVHGHDLIWFDNAATTQKPQVVIDRLSHFYTHENSNIHRSAHELAARSSDAYEAARESTKRYLNAKSKNEIVFVRGATEAINLVAQSWGRQNVQKDDEILITWLEHHANIVPWQMLCAEKGARLKVAPVNDNGDVMVEEFERLLGPRTKLVSFAQVSNALGTVTPVRELVAAAHRHGAKVLVDGAQSVSHMTVDVQAYDCDFFVFSGHKVYAPTGIGVLYAKEEVLDGMVPWQGGGNMIHDVTFERTIYQPPPLRFEAGTGNIADAVGLGTALDYLSRIGLANVARHEEELLLHAEEELSKLPGLHILGKPKHRAGVLSFILDGFRTEEVSSYLNQQGIAVRAGHHCAQPILRRFGVENSVRPSFAIYNTCAEVDALILALRDLTRSGAKRG